MAALSKKLKAEQLITFCTVAKLKNISEAALELGLSQPALSRQLASLQRIAKQSLYQRTAHGIELSKEGKDFLPYACAVTHSMDVAESYLQATNNSKTTTLRIGISHHLITRFTGPLLQKARTYNQNTAALQIKMIEGYSSSLITQLKDNKLDAAIIVGDADDYQGILKGRPAGEDEIGLMTLPDDPVAKDHKIPFSAIAGETLIVSSSESSVYKTIRAIITLNNIKLGRIIEVSGPSAVRHAVIAGQGIGVTLKSFIDSELKAGWLKFVGIENIGLKQSISFVSKDPNTLDTATAQALDALYGQA